ncbi:MAG: hypothetical protein ACPGJS_04360 [Flammeovirgaceae bacterium]
MKGLGKVLIIIVIIGFGIFLTNDVEAQCSMCRASVANSISDGGRTFGAGLNKGILYLMLMPYIVISIIGYAWYKSSKKYTAQRQKLANALRLKFN